MLRGKGRSRLSFLQCLSPLINRVPLGEDCYTEPPTFLPCPSMSFWAYQPGRSTPVYVCTTHQTRHNRRKLLLRWPFTGSNRSTDKGSNVSSQLSSLLLQGMWKFTDIRDYARLLVCVCVYNLCVDNKKADFFEADVSGRGKAVSQEELCRWNHKKCKRLNK